MIFLLIFCDFSNKTLVRSVSLKTGASVSRFAKPIRFNHYFKYYVLFKFFLLHMDFIKCSILQLIKGYNSS